MTSGDAPTDFATLVDLAEGRLAPADARRVEHAVASGDDRTQATLRWLRAFIDMARRVELEDPPAFVRRNLMRHFSAWSVTRAEDPDAGIVAELSFDSRRDLALSGIRGADVGDDGDAFHLAFASGAADVLIDATRRASGRFDIEGQVLPADGRLARRFGATLYGQAFTARAVDTDDLGRFSIPDVAPERCRLRVDNGDVAIVAQLDLRPGPET